MPVALPSSPPSKRRAIGNSLNDPQPNTEYRQFAAHFQAPSPTTTPINTNSTTASTYAPPGYYEYQQQQHHHQQPTTSEAPSAASYSPPNPTSVYYQQQPQPQPRMLKSPTETDRHANRQLERADQ
jgi:hypothetical protein